MNHSPLLLLFLFLRKHKGRLAMHFWRKYDSDRNFD